MALNLLAQSVAYVPSVAPVAPLTASRTSAPVMETVADLEALAKKLNPTVGYYNPLKLGETSAGAKYDTEAAIGFLRHAEIKHGRVAMAAFVGFIVQSNGIHFPGMMTLEGLSYADVSALAAPAAQWDAIPTAAKLQIFGVIALLELWGESSTALAAMGEKHYMRGGKPGVFPSFTPLRETIGQPPLDLFDPFGFQKKMTPEAKEKSLLAEINNGRLAQIGILGFAAASKGLIVPGMDKLGIAPYSGEYMAPFSDADISLPFVSKMLESVGNLGY